MCSALIVTRLPLFPVLSDETISYIEYTMILTFTTVTTIILLTLMKLGGVETFVLGL